MILAAQIVDAHTVLIGTFVLMLIVTAVMLGMTYLSLQSELHSPAALRETDAEDAG